MTDEAAKAARNSDRVGDLDAQLSHLKHLLDSLRLRKDRHPGDLCLRGFAIHVWENASAMLELVKEAKFAAAAWACGRAAFEAGQDALLLATAEDYPSANTKEKPMPTVEPSGVILHGICDIQTERCTAKAGGAITAVWGPPGRTQINVCRACLEEQMRRGEWKVEGARVRQPV